MNGSSYQRSPAGHRWSEKRAIAERVDMRNALVHLFAI